MARNKQRKARKPDKKRRKQNGGKKHKPLSGVPEESGRNISWIEAPRRTHSDDSD